VTCRHPSQANLPYPPATALYPHGPRHWPQTRGPPQHGSNDLWCLHTEYTPIKVDCTFACIVDNSADDIPTRSRSGPASRLPTSRGDPLAWPWILPHPAMLELAPTAPSSPAWAALALAHGNNSQAFFLFLHFTNCPGTSFRLAIHLTG
jgi:hypothetical protein